MLSDYWILFNKPIYNTFVNFFFYNDKYYLTDDKNYTFYFSVSPIFNQLR